MLRRSRLYTAMVILVATVGALQAEEKTAGTKTPITGVDRSYMDPTISPCKDLYAYANGAFEKVSIPGEYAAYGVNEEIDEHNFAILKEILENSARVGGPKGSVVQRYPIHRFASQANPERGCSAVLGRVSPGWRDSCSPCPRSSSSSRNGCILKRPRIGMTRWEASEPNDRGNRAADHQDDAGITETPPVV
jgi:hypothetical protein